MRPATTRPVFEPLEQRLLYSADFAPAALAGFGTPEFGEQRLLQTEDTAVAAHASLEIAFVDMSLPDAERLVSDLLAQRSAGRPIEVVRIGSDEDGIARIGQALDGRSGITAVHVLSHGSDGAVQLGNAQARREHAARARRRAVPLGHRH